MILKHFSNKQLHEQTLNAANKERLSTIELLWHLRENEKRMLFAEMGYRDLKEYCVKELKISEASAWRRISAMRLLKEIPEIKGKIQSGDLNLTQIVMARTHFRESNSTTEQKTNILLALENQSTRSTERILAENKPESLTPKPEVIERALRGHRLEVTLVLDECLQNELEEIQILLGKPYSKLELLKLLATEKLEKLKKDLNKSSSAKTLKFDNLSERSAQPPRNENSRYVAQEVLREIKVRDQNQCRFFDPISGRQCSARFHLQTEHVVPFAKGGESTVENLQQLCANHNRLRAVQHFGAQKMQTYLPGLG